MFFKVPKKLEAGKIAEKTEMDLSKNHEKERKEITIYFSKVYVNFPWEHMSV